MRRSYHSLVHGFAIVLFVFLASPIPTVLAGCPNCGREDCGGCSGGSRRGGSAIGVGVTIDLGGKKNGGEEEEDPFAEPPEEERPKTKERPPTTPPEEQEDNSSTYVEVENPQPCHCQGARLLLIAGVFDSKFPENPEKNTDRLSRTETDKDIGGTMTWARGLRAGHLHRIAYRAGQQGDSLSMGSPYEVNAAGDGWQRMAMTAKSPKKVSRELAQKWKDCCYFDEVIIIMHGGQNAYPQLVDFLPIILDGKPVKKLVIWSCRSTRKFLPADTVGKNYQKIAGIVKPKSCPCQCDPARCNALDADGRPAPKCPTAEDETLIYASYLVDGAAVPLGLDPKDGKNPFLTPDGQLRRITVDKEGNIEAEAVDAAAGGTSIFGGKGVKSSSDLRPSSEKIDPKIILKKSKAVDPPPIEYQGPKCCANKDGCQVNDEERKGLVR